MSKRVRIISVPPGQAPGWVRKAWVGLELPLAEEPQGGVQFGALRGKPENLGGYHVPSEEALAILEQKNPKAAKWWRDIWGSCFPDHFVFKREVCELIS